MSNRSQPEPPTYLVLSCQACKFSLKTENLFWFDWDSHQPVANYSTTDSSVGGHHDRKTILKSDQSTDRSNRSCPHCLPEPLCSVDTLPIEDECGESPLWCAAFPPHTSRAARSLGHSGDSTAAHRKSHATTSRCLISIQAAWIFVVCSDSFQSSKAFTSAREQDGVRNGSSRIGLRSGLTSQL